MIIGNGVAGTTAAEQIRKMDTDGRITIISDEEYPYYSRIRLIDYLAGKIDQDELILKKIEWYDDNKIDLLLNDAVVKIEKDGEVVITQTGKRITYDKILLATGANAFIPPISGVDKQGVFTLRRLRDAIAIKKYCNGGGKRVVILGGGVLGLEVGNALRIAGNEIFIIEALLRLLPRQMDLEGSKILQSQLTSMGLGFYIGHMTKEIKGTDSVTGVLLDDGTEINCDLIIICAGIRPELILAKQLEVKIERGVVVDDDLCPNLPGIYCAGDLICHRGKQYGIWPASEKQGEVAGINMAKGKAIYRGTVPSNTLKIAGIDLVSIGEIDAEGKYESIVIKDYEKYIYHKLVLEDNKIIGAILYGDKKGWLKIKRAIEEKKDISKIKEDLTQWNFTEF